MTKVVLWERQRAGSAAAAGGGKGGGDPSDGPTSPQRSGGEGRGEVERMTVQLNDKHSSRGSHLVLQLYSFESTNISQVTPRVLSEHA